MTPDELRALVEAARVEPIYSSWTGQSMVRTGSRKTSELLRLERCAPELALLLADFVERLSPKELDGDDIALLARFQALGGG